MQRLTVTSRCGCRAPSPPFPPPCAAPLSWAVGVSWAANSAAALRPRRRRHTFQFAAHLPPMLQLCINAALLAMDASLVHHIRSVPAAPFFAVLSECCGLVARTVQGGPP